MIKAKTKKPKAKRVQAALLAFAIVLGMLAAVPLSAAAAPPDAPPVLSGWQEMGGAWYYYIDGVRQTGWIVVDGKDYYLGSNGKMATGWVDWQGSRYYLSSEGEMLTGWLEQGGRWYYLDPSSGAMTKGWVQYMGHWYFFDNKGAMQTGWVKANNSRYYFTPGSGEMVTGWQMLDNRWHYFAPTGEMVTGWLPYEGKWYYMDKDGRMVAREWRRVDGKWYNFSATGSLYSSATGDGSPSLSDNQSAFVDRYQAHAAALSAQYRIPWEAVIAQGILESAAGTSNFARTRNNFFGIGAVDYNPNNANYYSSPEAGWEGYYRFIRDNGRYERHGVFHEPNVTDPYAYAIAIKAAGYATDPNYVSKLHYLITAVLNRANDKGWSTTVLLLG